MPRVTEGRACKTRLPGASYQAQNNSIDNFRFAFDKKFMSTILTRVDANDEIFKRILDDDDFRLTLGEFYLRKVYERLNRETSAIRP